MRFVGRHGVHDWEQTTTQAFEVDVELVRDLRPAGETDDLESTIDYGLVYRAIRPIVEARSFKLLESIAEAISDDLLARFDVIELVVRVRKPEVKLDGPLDYAGVEITRGRSEPGRPSGGVG